jgi:ubiquitin-like domain-containing CTD phosphatase 1
MTAVEAQDGAGQVVEAEAKAAVTINAAKETDEAMTDAEADGDITTNDDENNENEEEEDETLCSLVAKFGKDRIILTDLPASTTTIKELKDMLQVQTRVLPMRQKLIGLNLDKKNNNNAAVAAGAKRKVTDDTTLMELKPKPMTSKSNTISLPEGALYFECILMGTPEDAIFVDPAKRDDLPDVIDDFDLDFTAGSELWERHVANQDLLKQSIAQTEIHVMNAPRPNYPLMVLDLDHTLLDFSSKALRESTSVDHAHLHAQIMKRPFMDEFLTRAYVHYDLVVWSQTSWRWLETKLIELGMVSHPGYKFTFVLDKTSMFAITSTKKNSGEHYRHHVKPLELIWTKFPTNYNATNTVHVDDLTRNFALNMPNGLRIKAYYRKKLKKRTRDVELEAMSIYLDRLAKEAPNQFDLVDFNIWQDVVNGSREFHIKPRLLSSSSSAIKDVSGTKNENSSSDDDQDKKPAAS